ncbi:DNA-binding protein SMUBP-2 isoform X1 [Arapaima gigas]
MRLSRSPQPPEGHKRVTALTEDWLRCDRRFKCHSRRGGSGHVRCGATTVQGSRPRRQVVVWKGGHADLVTVPALELCERDLAMDVECFVSKTLELLREEREAEIEEMRLLQQNLSLKDLQHRGVCLLKLQIGSQRTSLYGRHLVVFEPRKHVAGTTLPSNNFGPGDIVGVYDSAQCRTASQLGTGVVTRVTPMAISVAIDESQDSLSLEGNGLYSLLKLANDVTYRRLKNALTSLHGWSGGTASRLINVLFGSSKPSTSSQSSDIDFINTSLDESQREAVSFALSQREVAIIHGPPGTGKTTTVVEIILQAVKGGLKVLCCAPSNVAVDNLVERLAASQVRLLRLGHPARLLESAQEYSLDAVLAREDSTSILADIRTDIDKACAKIRKALDKGERSQLWAEVRELRRELRSREDTAIVQALKSAHVILATNTGASDDGPLKLLPTDHFDLVVIDECSQALECSCWIPLLKASRCVLAGDHHQLPPTVMSPIAASKGLAISLMERLIQKLDNSVVRMLTVQYRMNGAIMRWASEQMYQGRLIAYSSVESHLLRDLPGVVSTEETDVPLFLIDTAGCGLFEMEDADEQSRSNEGEANVVAMHVEALTKAGVKARDIAVIAPYNLQVDLLRQRLSQKHPQLEIKSVDGFQGREKEAVVLSLVRSNRKGEVGFLAEDRRINVAVTRARRHIAVVCDTQTVRHHGFLRSLVDYMTEHGEVRTAFEYLEDPVPQNYSHDQGSKQTRGQRVLTGKTKERHPKGKKTKYKSSPERSTFTVDKSLSHQLRNDRPLVSTRSEAKSHIEELREQLIQFLKDSNRAQLDFPTSLSSHDRLLVHQISEELGLKHESTGEGRERHITVSKATAKLEPEEEQEEQEHGIQQPAEFSYSEQASADHNKQPQGGTLRTGQEDLKALHLKCTWHEKARREEMAKQWKVLEADTKCQTSKKSKRTAKGCVEKANPASDDDFDALISAAVKADSVCAFVKCKVSVLTLGQLCPFCSKHYCLSHHIPEVHGCGDKAKSQARRRISKEGVLYAGSSQKDRAMDPNKKAHLQRKLESKLKDLASQRKSKQREKE